MGKHIGKTIYFAEVIETGIIKIGRTANISNRMSRLKNQVNGDVRLLGIMEGDAELERRIKWKFERYLFKPFEWFYPHASVLAFIQENTIPYAPKVREPKVKLKQLALPKVPAIKVKVAKRRGRPRKAPMPVIEKKRGRPTFEEFIQQSDRERESLMELLAPLAA